MAARKDKRGRALRKGEFVRKSDNMYVYTYVDALGKRRSIYSKDLQGLREKEKRVLQDQMDGVDSYAAGKEDLNYLFDRYISIHTNIRDTTKQNYQSVYNRYVRKEFGKRNSKRKVRHPLSVSQQKALMEFLATDPDFLRWKNLFTFFMGTGCRMGETVGLRWEDID